MSITGRKQKTFRKLDVKESKSGAKGFTKIVFAHKASAGDTLINVNSLNAPTTEMPTLVNPSSSRIIEARMFQFKKNITVISSLSGVLIQDLSYVISSNNTITFKDFTAADGEIFTIIIDASPISGLQVVDARTPTAEGTLEVGEDEFVIGFATLTGRNDLVLYRNGIEQKRNTNNSDSVLDGNYYVIDSGEGFGSVVKFNDPTVSTSDYIRAVGVGNTVESPANSTWDEIEKLQGQIDSLVPTVADIAGVPESNFQATPNSVDLKQFGDRVLGLEQTINTKKKIKASNSAQLTPSADNVWHQHSGNSVVLDQAGVWLVRGWVDFGRSSQTPYDTAYAKWSDANGDNTSTTPPNLSNVISGRNFTNDEIHKSDTPDGFASIQGKMVDMYVNVSSPQTVYLNTRALDVGGLFNTMRIVTAIQAEYLGTIELNGTEVG